MFRISSDGHTPIVDADEVNEIDSALCTGRGSDTVTSITCDCV
jgi:hypothetical protein